MEGDTIKTFSGQVKALVEANKDFPLKLKQRLVSEYSKVENPFKFIVELFNEGVLCDGSNDLEAYFGFKEILVQLAVTIGCSKVADGIGGLVKALETSGNLQLLSALQTCAKEDLGLETDTNGDSSEPEEGNSAAQKTKSQVLATQTKNDNITSLCGAKLVDKIMSQLEEYGSYLARANLDGSNATVISTGFRNLTGIALHPRTNGVLYWADIKEDNIGTIDVDGANKRTLLKLEDYPGPSGIQVDAQMIYFGTFDGKRIQSVNKDSGEELTKLFHSTGEVRQLALFNAQA